MNTIDILRPAGADGALQSLAKAYGLTPEQLNGVVAAVVPALSNRIERNTLSRGGLADMVGELLRPEHARALADPAQINSPAAQAAGVSALDTIFGSKATSRSVAAQAAMSTGIEQAIIQKLLPIIASLVMAALSKGVQGGGLGDILKKLPDLAGAGSGPSPMPQPRGRSGGGDPWGRDQPQPPVPGMPGDGGLGDVLSKIPGFPGSQPTHAPQPTRNAPPVTDDGAFGGGSPLPIPGDVIPGINGPANNPYGNLPDVIRRGGGPAVEGGSLGDVIRNTIGSSLGFQSKGFFGWIIRLIVLRWGWGLVRSILGRVLTGR